MKIGLYFSSLFTVYEIIDKYDCLDAFANTMTDYLFSKYLEEGE
jgi:hypothetical protein